MVDLPTCCRRCCDYALQIVIGGRNKYLINGHVAQPSRVQTMFHSVQLNVNNPHFLIMQGRITKVPCPVTGSPGSCRLLQHAAPCHLSSSCSSRVGHQQGPASIRDLIMQERSRCKVPLRHFLFVDAVDATGF
jgi:hypothetical protein